MSLNFTLSPEQVETRKMMHDLFHRLESKRAQFREQSVRKKEFPQEIWDAMAHAKVMGALIPKKWGGTDAGLLTLTFAIEAMGMFGFGSFLPILTQMATICVARHATHELQAQILPPIAQGKIKCCIGATEAHSGMNMFGLKTFAEAQGEHYLINGSKNYISGADIADAMLLIARTQHVEDCEEEGLPKTIGFSLFWMNPREKGVTQELLHTRGEISLKQYALRLENVRVPALNMVGPEDGGVFVLFDAMNVERILMAALALGLSEYCLARSIHHALHRKVFGDVPIGQYQSVQHPLAEVKIRQEALRLMVYKAAWLFDQHKDPTDTGFYANCAKYLATEVGLKSVDAAIETFGGKGFDEDADIIHLWESVRLLKAVPLSNNMILNFVAEHELRLPRSY
jgi:alkylation response protein AidB-like acyl-CoA dehydrogenase